MPPLLNIFNVFYYFDTTVNEIVSFILFAVHSKYVSMQFFFVYWPCNSVNLLNSFISFNSS